MFKLIFYHGCNGSIAVVSGNAVKGDGTDTGKSLSGDGGCSSGDDFLHESSFKGNLAMTVMKHALLSTHHEKNDESTKLTYD